jgi:hypothetical protein
LWMRKVEERKIDEITFLWPPLCRRKLTKNRICA